MPYNLNLCVLYILVTISVCVTRRREERKIYCIIFNWRNTHLGKYFCLPIWPYWLVLTVLALDWGSDKKAGFYVNEITKTTLYLQLWVYISISCIRHNTVLCQSVCLTVTLSLPPPPTPHPPPQNGFWNGDFWSTTALGKFQKLEWFIFGAILF